MLQFCQQTAGRARWAYGERQSTLLTMFDEVNVCVPAAVYSPWPLSQGTPSETYGGNSFKFFSRERNKRGDNLGISALEISLRGRGWVGVDDFGGNGELEFLREKNRASSKIPECVYRFYGNRWRTVTSNEGNHTQVTHVVSFQRSCLQQHNDHCQWKFSSGFNMFALRAFIHHVSKPVALTRQLLENAKSSRMAKFITMYPVGTINHYSIFFFFQKIAFFLKSLVLNIIWLLWKLTVKNENGSSSGELREP